MRNLLKARPELAWSGAAALAALVLMACVTINVYFPEAAVKDLSEQIEEEIEKAAEEEEGAPNDAFWQAPQPSPERSGLAAVLLSLATGASPVYADEVPQPEITNPAIRKLIDSRAARLPDVNRHKASGVLGESNKALLEIRNLDAVADLRQRAEVQRLVKEENADREQLFKEVAAAKSVDLSQLPQIRATYAETLREKARRGDWIQLPDGTWKQK